MQQLLCVVCLTLVACGPAVELNVPVDTSTPSCAQTCDALSSLCPSAASSCPGACEVDFTGMERRCILVASMCAEAVACDRTDDGNTQNNAEFRVHEKPASEYYAQFVWDDENKKSVSGAASFPESEEGHNFFLLDVFLMKSGDANLFYVEGNGTVTSTGQSGSLFDDTQTRLDTTWRLEGTRLRIGDVLDCMGITLDGEEGMSCKLLRPIVTQEAAGRNARMKNDSGDTPEDSIYADYVLEGAR